MATPPRYWFDLADRQDVGRRLPDLLIAQHPAPRRHADAVLLPAIGDRWNTPLGSRSRRARLTPPLPSSPWQCAHCFSRKFHGRPQSLVGSLRSGTRLRIDGAAPRYKDPCEPPRQVTHSPRMRPLRKNSVGRPVVLAAPSPPYFASLKAISVEAAGTFSSCGNNAGSKIAA